MPGVVCLNGRFLPASRAQISAVDQGFLYGYGLFETILVRAGRPVFLEAHLKRLEAGCRALGIALPFPPAAVSRLVHETIRQNGLADGALRLTLSAGPAPGESPGELVIFTRPLSAGPGDYERGLAAGWSVYRRNERSPLVKLKTLNYLENLLAKREAREKGWAEALFLNTAGYVAEGTISNVFIVFNGQVVTPSVDQGLLPGIMRRTVLKICCELGIPAVERPVAPAELVRADECFLTNSLLIVMPLVKINDRPIGNGRPGRLTERIRTAIMSGMMQ
ncbi:MAG: aminotransferase class IV [Armatimonadetes bacterium]|nr:aminotransferase class IV [Armatimonadota bacterium]